MNKRPARRAVVIGAGMGGLAAATDLARAGLAVTLLEQAGAPGGKVRTLEVDGQGIDSGPTVFTMRWVFESLFRDAGASFEERLRLSPLDVLARHGWLDGSRLDLFADVERSASAIAELAGAREADAYRDFAQRSEQIFTTLDHSFMRREKPGMVALSTSLGLRGMPRLLATKPFTSLWSELGSCFRDPRLRQLFGRYATYCGSSPLQAPATLMLIAHAERAGVWALDDGMQRLPEAMAALAREQGVELRFGCAAKSLEVEGGRVRAVHCSDEQRIAADVVVYNGDVDALAQGLLGDAARRALPRRSKEPRSLSAMTWSLVGRLGGFPLHHHTVLFGNNYEDEFRAIFERGEVTGAPTLYLCAQDYAHKHEQAQGGVGENPVQPVSAPPGQRLFILVNAPPGRLGEARADALQQKVWSMLERHGVQLEAFDGRCVRTTPDDYASRFPGSNGAIYGWPTHGWQGSFKRAGARGRLAGLYFAGGTVHPGPGIPMATLSGRIAAERALQDMGHMPDDQAMGAS